MFKPSIVRFTLMDRSCESMNDLAAGDDEGICAAVVWKTVTQKERPRGSSRGRGASPCSLRFHDLTLFFLQFRWNVGADGPHELSFGSGGGGWVLTPLALKRIAADSTPALYIQSDHLPAESVKPQTAGGGDCSPGAAASSRTAIPLSRRRGAASERARREWKAM